MIPVIEWSVTIVTLVYTCTFTCVVQVQKIIVGMNSACEWFVVISSQCMHTQHIVKSDNTIAAYMYCMYVCVCVCVCVCVDITHIIMTLPSMFGSMMVCLSSAMYIRC